MNIYIALTLFSLVILLYWVVSELFTTLFRFTGLPVEKARFQVISLLTGCGFTTHESELFLTARSRRRLTRVTMLFGYVFNITIVSMLINVFVSIKFAQLSNYFSILIPLLAAAVIIVFMRVPRVRAWGDRFIEKMAGRVAHMGDSNSIMPIDYLGEDSIAQVTLRKVPEAYVGKTLSQSGLRPEHNILVLLIERPGQKAKPAGARTVFQDGDKLTVYGDYRTICRVFDASERFGETDEAEE
ncbi:MAG: TrkA C-terminal domain-containing protein [Clostridia bacterium]|nr:TrkA C-terminal domain-containing protein [Clostridia bacterium]